MGTYILLTTMKISAILSTSLLALGLTSAAHAITFTPSPADLNDLDHDKAVKWGISYSLPSGHTITGATLTITNINNWAIENDALFIHLLNETINGVSFLNDNTAGLSDYFGNTDTSTNKKITTFTDDNEYYNRGWRNPSETFTYTFTSTQLGWLNSFAADNGKFALGFDPDCHYYNDGVCLTITTGPSNGSTVPDTGSSVLLMGASLIGLAALRRRCAAR